MRIFHIATAADWAEARQRGSYRTSTRGRSLEDEGFIHAARSEQVAGVFERYYRDAGEPLVLLTIDPARLDVECREDQVGNDTYPHIYGPLPVRAVVRVEPLSKKGRPRSLLQVAIADATRRLALALAVMVFAVVCAVGVRAAGGDGWAPFAAACAGLGIGGGVAFLLSRRR